MGKLSDSVKLRCLDRLTEYAFNPRKLIMVSIENSADNEVDIDLRWIVNVCVICLKMVVKIIVMIEFIR